MRMIFMVLSISCIAAHCGEPPECTPQSTTCDDASIMLCDDKGRWVEVIDCNALEEGSTCGEALGEFVCKEAP